MNTTKVTVEDLLARLRENRDKHKAQFKEARETWEAQVKDRFSNILGEVEGGDFERVEFPLENLPKPEHFLKSYDLAIERLEWEQDDVVELDAKEFANYVLDNWDWRGQFANTTAIYAAL